MGEGVNVFKLDANGLRRVLGDLEAAILELLWARGGEPAAIRDVQEGLDRPLAFNTVMTVMNRLVEKGLLRRSGHRRSYLYAPTCTREEFLERLARRVSEGLVQDFGPLAVAQFVDALDELAPEALAELERRLAERRRQR